MRLLVAIANHGTKNQRYLDRLLREYRSMTYDVHVVVLSDSAKDLGPDVEVKVGLPAKDPWSLPFGHKQLFVERQDDYDLFIYSEDDTLITQRNIEAFLAATAVLPPDRIAGFLRYEEDGQGQRYCSSMHSHYHWRPGSLRRYGGDSYAYYTNMHSAAFLLTQSQLKHCIASGGFAVGPHQGRYDLLCTAATDPYTQCGLEKVICISRIDDFLLHHLPNQYLGKLGLSFEEMRIQIERIVALGEDGSQRGLIPEDTGLDTWYFEKWYYGDADASLVRLVPTAAKTVLSVGAGQAQTEKRLLDSGRQVDAIPLDPLIAALAENRGVACLEADWRSLFDMPREKAYDLILLSDILCYAKDPMSVLVACRRHISAHGYLLLSFINRGNPRVRRRYRPDGTNSPAYWFWDSREIGRRLAETGWRVAMVSPPVDEAGRLKRTLLRVLKHRLAARLMILARADGGQACRHRQETRRV